MAKGPQLVNFSLLSCDFAVVGRAEEEDETESAVPDAPAAPVEAPDEAGPVDGDGESSPLTAADAVEGVLELEGVSLSYAVTQEEEQFVLILQTTLTDPLAPYELTVVTGSRYTLPDPPASAENAAATLVFISYPYVREIFTNPNNDCRLRENGDLRRDLRRR